MKTWRPTSRLRRAVTVAAVACLATTAATALTATPASATDTASLTTSNNALNAPDVTYTWAFTTTEDLNPGATTPTALKQITLTVPTGTTAPGALTVDPYGLLGCATASAAFSAPTVTVTFGASPGSSCTEDIPAGTPMAVEIGGLSNPATAPTTAQLASTVTVTGGSQTDTFTATAPAYASNTTAVNVIVPESLTFTNNGPSTITLVPAPGVLKTAANPVGLTVSTNAGGGYTLAACMATALTYTSSAAGNPIYTIPASPTAKTALSDTNAGFGAVVSNTTSGGDSVTPGTNYAATSTTYATSPTGYATDCGSGIIGSGDGPTSGDDYNISNQVWIKSTQAAGNYSGTITYKVTPTY